MKVLFALSVILLMAGCSNKAVYDNIQLNMKNECRTLPQSQYEECMEDASTSYEEYEENRQEMLKE
ncbi:hypothetical protein A9Q99_14465 [Gammaproteobacteria bacterium 45_16_T64]|nr:hypothetical protein A9Q99_14465 [Gammaproteobacteria bacterium 45_16_T64]